MTNPDQYRREGAEAMRKEALYQCVRVPAELPGSPRMAFELGLYSCESAIRAIDVDDVLAGLRPRCAECDCEDGNCTWIKAGPDPVGRLVEAARAFASWDHCWPGNINLEAACRDIRAALAAMEANR